jgi:hypothetical protein
LESVLQSFARCTSRAAGDFNFCFACVFSRRFLVLHLVTIIPEFIRFRVAVALAPRALSFSDSERLAPASFARGMACKAAEAGEMSYLSAAAAADIDEKLMGAMGYTLDQLMVISTCAHASESRSACRLWSYVGSYKYLWLRAENYARGLA